MDEEELALPWRYAGLALVRYGGVMLQLESEQGYVLSFTPQSNEFTITMRGPSAAGRTAGLCGNISYITPLRLCYFPSDLKCSQLLLTPALSLYLSFRRL